MDGQLTGQRNSEVTCFEKAQERGQPTFTLIAQDITADLVVDFWIKAQQKVREHMDAGLTMTQAVKAVRSYYFLEPDVPADDAKLSGACAIAEAMSRWPNRKIAD